VRRLLFLEFGNLKFTSSDLSRRLPFAGWLSVVPRRCKLTGVEEEDLFYFENLVVQIFTDLPQ
jgi:hypothetical protein